MLIIVYEVNFHALLQYFLKLLTTEEEIGFCKRVKYQSLVFSLQMKSSSKTFQEMVDFIKKLKGVRNEYYIKIEEKKANKVHNYSGIYSRG